MSNGSEALLPQVIGSEVTLEAPVNFDVLPRAFINKFKAADTTPSVLNLEVFETSGSAVSVTFFDDGQDGQRVSVKGDGMTTIVHDLTKIRTNTGGNKLLSPNAVYTFTRFGGAWVEGTGGTISSEIVNISVKENNVIVSSTVSTLDFLGAHFNVVESPVGEVNIEVGLLGKVNLPSQIAYEDEANTFIAGQVVGTDPGGSEALRVGGGIFHNAGYRQSGTVLARFENTFLSLPPGATGPGLEVGAFGGSTLLQSYNRTTAAYVRQRYDALDFAWHPGAVEKMVLTTAALTPATAGGLTHGTVDFPWGEGFFGRLNGPALALKNLSATGNVHLRFLNSSGTRRAFVSKNFVIDGESLAIYNEDNAAIDFGTSGLSRMLLEANGDLTLGSLGRFDSTDVPLESHVLLYHAGATNKWQAESLQLIYNAGDAAVALLVDNTSTQFLYFDPGAGADSPVGAPPVPVLKLFATHKGVTVASYASTTPDVFYHDGPSYPADFRHFLYEYSTDNFVADTKSLATASSDKVNHGRLTVGTTYYYRARAVDRAGNASANSATVSFVAVANSDTSNFGVVLATEIAVDRLAALSANIGIITAGQLRNIGNTAGVNLGGAGGIPGTWTHGINLEAATGSGSMTRYLNFTASGAASFFKHERLEMNVDGSVKMYLNSLRPLFNLTSADYYLQNDLASPTHGLLLAGTRPASWKRYLDLVDGVLTIKDDQGLPVTRVQAGKVGAGAQDYGLQVFDKDAATVMDFTGAKRILAVPVQPSVDSGGVVAVDLSTGLTQQVRLTSNSATVRLLNPTNGSRYRIWFQQDATGSRPFPQIRGVKGALDEEIVMFSNDTPPTLTTTPGAFDLFELEYRTNPTSRFTCMTLQTNVLLPTPIVDSVTGTSVSVASTTHNVAMPATVLANDLLLMFITYHATQGAVTTPAGWTLGGTIGLLSVFWKVAVGNEDGTTVNVVTVNSVKAAAQVYRMHRWLGTTAGVEINLDSGVPGTSSDPANLAPTWGADKTLWMAGTSVTGGPGITDPANYANFNETNDGAATCKVRTGRRVLYATSEDPGAFTWIGDQSWTSIVVAVRPPA